ncbi:MAG: hypothetical protein B6D42_02510 [Anaerolineae bacterium UTCFX5]|nr:MAG: hypothetical protein B6D42_02510 [Anaerolineae bacterium UTCFX5]
MLPLDLLPNISPRTCDSLRARGFVCIEDVAQATPDDLRTVKGIKTTAEVIHAHAVAYVNHEPFLIAPRPSDLLDTTCAYLDIETDPFNGGVWSITIRSDDEPAQTVLVCDGLDPLSAPDDPRFHLTFSQAEGWDLARELLPANTPVLHWTGFDSGVMRQTAAEPTRSQLDAVMRDLHADVKRTVAFPLKSRSLKAVAPYLGFQWKAYDRWDLALADFKRWVYDGDANSFTRMRAYIHDDVDAMHVVMSWLRAVRWG